jgi:hypothetical protein
LLNTQQHGDFASPMMPLGVIGLFALIGQSGIIEYNMIE